MVLLCVKCLLIDKPITPLYSNFKINVYGKKTFVEQQFKRLDSIGIIETIGHSEWGTPTVPVGYKSLMVVKGCVEITSVQ